MKKALVVLLILAVAGGVFAQSVSVSGLVNAGLGMLKYDGVDDAGFGLLGHNQGVNGMRTQINFNGTNKDGNAGFSVRLRAAAAPASWASNLNFRWAYGWLKAVDGLLDLRAGRIQGNNFDTLDPITDGDTHYDSYGLLLYINPVDMVSIGVGAHTQEPMGAYDILDNHNMYGWLGFGLYLGVADVVAQMKATGNDVAAYLSTAITAVPILDIDATLGLWDISNFSDSGMIGIFPHVGVNIIDNLGINLAVGIWMPQASGLDNAFRFWFWLDYALGNIIPRIDVNYMIAGSFNDGGGFYKNSVVEEGPFDKDVALLTVSPSVLMKVAGNMHFELGYLLGIDMSKNDKHAIGGKNKGVNHAAFADVRVSF